jgi:gluconokinase
VAYLHIDYRKLVERVKAGGTDAEILEWAYENGRRLNEVERLICNEFARKRGWNDAASEKLVQYKQASGLSNSLLSKPWENSPRRSLV